MDPCLTPWDKLNLYEYTLSYITVALPDKYRFFRVEITCKGNILFAESLEKRTSQLIEKIW